MLIDVPSIDTRIVIEGHEFKDGDTVDVVFGHATGDATIVFRPNHGWYPKSKTGWYIRDWYYELRPIEQMTLIKPQGWLTRDI